jgi:hypothetical protein
MLSPGEGNDVGGHPPRSGTARIRAADVYRVRRGFFTDVRGPVGT